MKVELSILASSCSLPESVPNIHENGINLESYSSDTEIDSNLNFKSPYETEKDNVEGNLYRNKFKDESLSFSRDSLKIRNTPFSSNFSSYRALEKNIKKQFNRKPLTIRIVGIYVLASLRLIRILGNVRSERNLLIENPLLLSVKKNKRKMPQSVYQKSLGSDSRNVRTSKSGNIDFTNSPHGSLSLLELIASRDRRPALESSFTPREGRSPTIGHHESRTKSQMTSSRGKIGGREKGGGGGVGIFADNILVLRETLCNMSELIATLRAKELLLHVKNHFISFTLFLLSLPSLHLYWSDLAFVSRTLCLMFLTPFCAVLNILMMIRSFHDLINLILYIASPLHIIIIIILFFLFFFFFSLFFILFLFSSLSFFSLFFLFSFFLYSFLNYF